MFGVVFVFLRVAAVLPLKLTVLLHVGFEHIIRAHAQHLCQADEEMNRLPLHAGVLLVELLVFGPPFPRHAVGEFGDLLRHGSGVVEYPLGFLLLSHGVGSTPMRSLRIFACETIREVGLVGPWGEDAKGGGSGKGKLSGLIGRALK